MLDEEAQGALADLDALPAPSRAALARLVDAYLALEAAAERAYAAADFDALRDHAALPAELFRAAGLDLGPVLGARAELLDAAFAARDAFAAHPGAWPRQGPLIVPPFFAVDIGVTDWTYTDDLFFVFDAGGDDRYLNNAGGNGGNVAPCGLPFAGSAPASALVDLDGRDQYGDPAAPHRCGANGGGYFGVGALVDLSISTQTLDLSADDDVYVAAIFGVNGGAYVGGVGFLFDEAGRETYLSVDPFYGGVALGANGAGDQGVALLLDGGGDDVYVAGTVAANGGADGGLGLLLDVSGHDRYTGGSRSTNGGAREYGVGLLLDLAGADRYTAGGQGANGGGYGGIGAHLDWDGDDAYVATALGVNGGADPGDFNGVPTPLSIGLLLNIGGADTYQDSAGGTGADKTVLPKGLLGLQVDA